jgi:uncharacterized protein (TIGR03435 family)
MVPVDPGGGTAPRPVYPARIAPIGWPPQTSARVHKILPIRSLIADAFNLPFGSERRIVGGPDWIGVESEQYEITAKIDDALFESLQKMTPEQQHRQVAMMEQSLLAERFKLKVHFERREAPTYALVIARGRPKLTPAKNDEKPRLSAQGDEMTAIAVTLEEWLQSPFMGGRLAENRTGLDGRYDFTLTYSARSPDVAQDGGAQAPPLLNAVQDQLGLKLEPSKGSVEYIVVDQIERPSEN